MVLAKHERMTGLQLNVHNAILAGNLMFLINPINAAKVNSTFGEIDDDTKEELIDHYSDLDKHPWFHR